MPRTRTVNASILLKPDAQNLRSLMLVRSDLHRVAERLDQRLRDTARAYENLAELGDPGAKEVCDLYDGLMSDRENISDLLLPAVGELIDLLERSIAEDALDQL